MSVTKVLLAIDPLPGSVPPPLGVDEVLELPSTFLLQFHATPDHIIVINLLEAHLFLIISLNPKALQLCELGKFSCLEDSQ